MKVQQFEVPGLAQYSYVLSSQAEAIVVDPIRDYDRYLRYAAEHGLRIRYVTETHIHADFASGAAPLASAAGAELALSGCDRGERYAYSSELEYRALHDGAELHIGALRLRALHTPGHTPEHLSFVLFDGTRAASEPAALFSGDFLFVGSLGRPDLLGEDETQRMAHALYRSVHQRIADLPDGLLIYPGHGAGSLCGAGMSVRPVSTLGYERATQRLFHLEEQAFVRELLAGGLAMPSYYPRMKHWNAEGPADIQQRLSPAALTPRALSERIQAGPVTLLDLRRPEAFGGAHVPGAINIGAGPNLSLWAGWLLDADAPIVLLSEAGADEEARLSLLRVGLDRIEGWLEGGVPAWIGAGLPLARTQQLSVQEVHNRAAQSLVVDVRSAAEWRAGHIAGARHIMLGDLPQAMDRLPADRPLITVCGSGYRSSIAASLLARQGFAASSLHGGMTAWRNRQLPLEREPAADEPAHAMAAAG